MLQTIQKRSGPMHYYIVTTKKQLQEIVFFESSSIVQMNRQARSPLCSPHHPDHWSTTPLSLSRLASASIFASQGVATGTISCTHTHTQKRKFAGSWTPSNALISYRKVSNFSILIYFLLWRLQGVSEGQSRPRCRSSYNNRSNWRCEGCLLRCALPLSFQKQCILFHRNSLSVETIIAQNTGLTLEIIAILREPPLLFC